MTHKDAARNYAWILHLQRELYRAIPEAEKLAAAKAIDREYMLPEPKQEPLPVKA